MSVRGVSMPVATPPTHSLAPRCLVVRVCHYAYATAMPRWCRPLNEAHLLPAAAAAAAFIRTAGAFEAPYFVRAGYVNLAPFQPGLLGVYTVAVPHPTIAAASLLPCIAGRCSMCTRVRVRRTHHVLPQRHALRVRACVRTLEPVTHALLRVHVGLVQSW